MCRPLIDHILLKEAFPSPDGAWVVSVRLTSTNPDNSKFPSPYGVWVVSNFGIDKLLDAMSVSVP
ncbi:MAG: hypothetical protein IJK52_02995 [Oscillospiraceae bacterium]|nr:hypothetical protein [Oscillospiraceae bacterium]